MSTDTESLAGEQHSRWEWSVTGLVAVAAMYLGYTGMREWEVIHDPGHVDNWSIAYHTLQLFVLHAPHLDPPVPPQLHWGRFLGAAFDSMAAILTLVKVFPDKWKSIRLRFPWTSGHVVICGLGDIGQRLALAGRGEGKSIVAVEKLCPPSTRKLMREQGVLVLDGDAIDEAQLKAARVERAEFVIASCNDDGTNAAIAAKVDRILGAAAHRKSALVCRTLIRHPDILRLLSDEKFLNGKLPQCRVNFSDLDQHAVAARQVIRMHPLDMKPIVQKDDTIVRLVVIGFGSAGQSLAIHAARAGHFANSAGDDKVKGKRLRITVVEDDDAAVAEFKTRYPNLDLVCDFDTIPRATTSSGVVISLGELCKPDMQVTYAFCEEGACGDERNFSLGVDLMKGVKCPMAQALIRQSTRDGFYTLLLDPGTKRAAAGRIHAFGMVEDIFSWDVLLRESEDTVAQALHTDYQDRHGGVHKDWGDLREDIRDSNRQAADHIDIKLRALGYHHEKLTKDNEAARIPGFGPGDIELLAQMEHIRWCAERYLSLPPWKWGNVTDRDARISNALVEWDRLDDDDKNKDREQIAAIPGALLKIKRGIYR